MGKCESRHLKYDAAGGWVKSHLEGQPAIWAIHYLGWGGGESSGPCSSTTTVSTSTSATSTTLESSGSEGGKGNEGGRRWWQAVKGLGGEYPPRKSSFFRSRICPHRGRCATYKIQPHCGCVQSWFLEHVSCEQNQHNLSPIWNRLLASLIIWHDSVISAISCSLAWLLTKCLASPPPHKKKKDVANADRWFPRRSISYFPSRIKLNAINKFSSSPEEYNITFFIEYDEGHCS